MHELKRNVNYSMIVRLWVTHFAHNEIQRTTQYEHNKTKWTANVTTLTKTAQPSAHTPNNATT